MTKRVHSERRSFPTPAFAALLIVAGLAAYLPLFHAGFIWDDDASLTANALIHAPDGIRRLWFSTEPADYWPLSSTSLWIEWRLWGLNPLGYHLTNLALHLGSGLLLLCVLKRLGIPGARFAALLFILHPVNVESVAWIAQRKNLMAIVFYLLSILAFLRTGATEGSSSTETGALWPPWARNRWMGLSLLCFILALLSKGSAAPLPLVLAGILYWRRRPNRADWAGLSPFFAVAVLDAAVNVWFQGHGLPEAIRSAGLLERILGAGAALWFYLGKALLPIQLNLVYPQWHIQAGNPRWWVGIVATVLLTVLLCRRKRLRPALFAWGYYCALLLPALGLTDIAFMQYSLVADHYQHLALLGVVALAGAAWARWQSKAAAAIILCTLGVATFLQCGMYRDSETLYRTILKRDPRSWLAYNNLGILRDRAGKPDQAIALYRTALQFNPGFAGAHYDLGRLLAQKGDFAEAARQFGAALQAKPHFELAALDFGSALMQSGDLPQAIAQYEKAIQLDPTDATAHDYLGIAFAKTGNLDHAISEFQDAVRLRPTFLEAHKNLSDVLGAAGRSAEAKAEAVMARQLQGGQDHEAQGR